MKRRMSWTLCSQKCGCQRLIYSGVVTCRVDSLVDAPSHCFGFRDAKLHLVNPTHQIQDLIIRGVVQGPSLSILRLRKCGLKDLPPSALALLPSLRELDVSDNRIPSVPSALLQTCPLLGGPKPGTSM
jgi:hypothetical protein